MACARVEMPKLTRGTTMDEYVRDRNNFYMDLENWFLEHKWCAPAPTGPARHLFNSAWGQMMRVEFLDYDPPRDFIDYSSWVEHGGGDEWFQPEEPINPNRLNGHHPLADHLRRLGQAGG